MSDRTELSHRMSQPIPGSLAALAMAPRHIDFDVWTDALEALAYQLVYVSVKGARQLELDRAANDAVTQALAQIMDHARSLCGTPRPLLIAKDGVRVIEYEKLAEARAKVQVLTAELARASEVPASTTTEERNAWLADFEWLLHELLHQNTRLAKKRGVVAAEVQLAHNLALRSFLAHAQGVPACHLPVVLDSAGRPTIPYELYAASRAEAKRLQAQLDSLRVAQVEQKTAGRADGREPGEHHG